MLELKDLLKALNKEAPEDNKQEAKRLDLQRQRLDLQRQRLEFERQKHEARTQAHKGASGGGDLLACFGLLISFLTLIALIVVFLKILEY